MPATTTKNADLRAALDGGNSNIQPAAIKAAKLGRAASLIKVTFAGLTSAAAVDITTAASKTAATIGFGITLDTGENLPPIGQILNCRVTAGTATVGARVAVDTGGTAGAPGANGPGVVKISDDGKTLTFEAAVTGFVLTYNPRVAVPMTTTQVLGAP